MTPADSVETDVSINIYRLDEIRSIHRSAIGEQAFQLGQLLQRGYPVIPGMVISANYFRHFLRTINWSGALFRDLPNSSLHLDVDNPQQLQAVAQQLQAAIARTPLEADWLEALERQVHTLGASTLIWHPSIALQNGTDVRLSDRIRGLLAAQVGRAESSAIAQSLRQVWAELFRARSLFYWQRSGIALQQLQLGVVVQPMWNAIASGDFQLAGNRLKIRSIWGLGAALTNGEVVPDVYEIDLTSGAILVQEKGSKEFIYQVGVASPSGIALPSRSVACSITPAPSNQQSFALQEQQLHQLIHLAQQLNLEVGHALTVEWSICQPSAAAPPTLYFTQVWLQTAIAPAAKLHLAQHPQPSHSTHPSTPPPLTSAVLTGRGASPGRIFAPIWVIRSDITPAPIPPHVVVAAPTISPALATQLHHAAGLIAEQGGMTSHAAILARELGIPAVVGVAQATRQLQTGQVVCLDGDRGVVYPMPQEGIDSPMKADWGTEELTGEQRNGEEANTPSCQESFGIANATQVMVNLGRVTTLAALQNLPVDGVGLLRSEHLLLEVLQQELPSFWTTRTEELSQRILQRLQPIVEQFAPRPVFYRTLDLRSHEFGWFWSEQEIPSEVNPILGNHGVFCDRLFPPVFDAQLLALKQLQQSGLTNLRLLLPFVRSVEEFRFCRDRLQHFELDQTPGFEVWIMAEVPSVLFLLPDYVAAGVEGISIGTNDLAQLLLAIDRDHPQMIEAYDEAHPAVLRAVQQLILGAKQAGIPCSICGEAPVNHPEIIADLVRWGISSISVGPEAVEQTYRAIARAERELILQAARESLGQSPPV